MDRNKEWKCEGGRIIPFKDLEDRHLRNIIGYLVTKADQARAKIIEVTREDPMSTHEASFPERFLEHPRQFNALLEEADRRGLVGVHQRIQTAMLFGTSAAALRKLQLVCYTAKPVSFSIVVERRDRNIDV
jgi:hypothetical protein